MDPVNTSKNVTIKFPFLLVSRWILSGVLVGIGAWRVFTLIMNWSYWNERIVIDAAYSPIPWLAVECCVVVVGLLLAIRSKWVFVPLLAHIALFARQLYVGLGDSPPPSMAYAIWAAELTVFAYCAWLWLERKLK